MSKWHYQIVKKQFKNDILYGIVEMFDKPKGYTDSLIGWYESKEELIYTLELMLRDSNFYDVVEIK